LLLSESFDQNIQSWAPSGLQWLFFFIWWQENPVQLIQRIFVKRICQSLPNLEGKFSEIAVSRIVSSGLSRYSRILKFFFTFPLWHVAKFASSSCVFCKCYQMSNRPVLGGYEKKVRTEQGFKPVLSLNSSGYHIEWCPLWNLAAGFHMMWELGFWNPDQVCI
jgi:hypothetical protein